MFDERAYIARVEAANVDELAELLRRPTAEEEGALLAHLGPDRYDRLRGLALRQDLRRDPGPTRGRADGRGLRAAGAESKGNVVVIPGIMGSDLSQYAGGGSEQIWLSILRIVTGRLEVLRLAEDGRTGYQSGYDVRASGIMKRHYGEILLSLAQSWTVRAFWYDWRKDLELAAAELEANIRNWFGDDEPVHIVAHSMGGLVARTFIANYPGHWDRMLDRKWEDLSAEEQARRPMRGGRLVMLGTPNHGSFAIPRVITGLEQTLRLLEIADLRHGLPEILAILNSFVGTYQMLPSPLVSDKNEPLYRSETYGDLGVPQRHLDHARRHHDLLEKVVDLERMVYVAGCDQATYDSINDWTTLGVDKSYGITLDGDGRVPHALGMLRTSGGVVKTYYVRESHGSLTSNDGVLDALDELLGSVDPSDEAVGLATSPREVIGARRGAVDAEEVRQSLEASEAEDELLVAEYVRRRQRGSGPTAPARVTGDERDVEEALTRGFLGYEAADRPRRDRPRMTSRDRITIGLAYGGIQEVDKLDLGSPPVDAISIGHYLGVELSGAERALDEAIEAELVRQQSSGETSREEPRAERRPRRTGGLSGGLIADYAERGTISGYLGQPFFLSDPRPRERKLDATGQRVIAVAGMGPAGRFGEPELAVLARELCWSLGRLGKRHMATVLIGAGQGNLEIEAAVAGWIRGIKLAISGVGEGADRHRLQKVTFVEHDPRRIKRIRDAILAETRDLEAKKRLTIEFVGPDEAALANLRKAAEAREVEDFRKAWDVASAGDGRQDPTPTRITVERRDGGYRFGAITQTASIPEREIALDEKLVQQANAELAAETDATRQRERGQFLAQLLLPNDLQPRVSGDSPLVMMLDATTARIHWEALAEPSQGGPGASTHFWGLERGFTRQFRTTFAPPPEPPPPPVRLLRVLVVANPAEDSPLVNAEKEGYEIADLLASFNKLYERSTESRIEVVRLIGPRQATRTNVLRQLTVRTYNVLHFSGHCAYDHDNPADSGWIFSNGERLTARELTRIDRIPAFVFSNACDSGVTPERSGERKADLAPSFAESFFAQGVSNFVCTAWPVDDFYARQFALQLYKSLLGLVDASRGRLAATGNPKRMYEAMRDARQAVALDTANPSSVSTWATYQHYGDPNFRLFDPSGIDLSGLFRSSPRSSSRAARSDEVGGPGTEAAPTVGEASATPAEPAAPTS